MWTAAYSAVARNAPSEGIGAALLLRQVRGYARQRGGKPPPSSAAAASAAPIALSPSPSLPKAPLASSARPHDRPPTVAANAIAAAAAARARAAEAAAAAAGAAATAVSSSSAAPPPPFDAALAGAAPRAHRLIGDPRTGIADDTTERCPSTAAGNDVSVELMWTQERPGVTEWYRYSPFVRQQPLMRRDARLSDHSRNLVYLLRCADPSRWTVQDLARKFRVRRQRVLAVLALKEMEAQALEDGRLMGGGGGGGGGAVAAAPDASAVAAASAGGAVAPASLARGLRAYCMTVDLADVRLSAGSREPHDLADGAMAAVGGGGAGAASGIASEGQRSRKGGKQQQQQQQAEGWVWARSGRDGKGGGGASSQQQQQHQHQHQHQAPSLGADPAADLARVAPAQAATAQRLHVALLSLLQQHGHSLDRLLRALLAQVDAAEAHYVARVRGTPVERALELGWRAAAAGRAAAAAERARRASIGGGAQESGAAAGAGAAAEEAAGEAGGGAGGPGGDAPPAAPPAPMPLLFDFAAQRNAVRAAVDALRPLLVNAGPRAEREAAALAAELSALLGAAAPPPDGEDDALRAAASAAPPDTLARAFNALPRDQRQALLDRAPSAGAALDLRGADLTAVVSPFAAPTSSSGGGGGAAGGRYSSLSSASSSSSSFLANSPGGGGGGDAAASSYALGRWPGQVRPLVDVWGYEEVGADGGGAGAGPPRDPDALFAALLAPSGALPPLERAVEDVDACAAALGIDAAAAASSGDDALGSLDDFLAGGGGAGGEQSGSGSSSEGGGKGASSPASAAPSPLPSCADVLALREDVHTYQHLDWMYDRAVDHQAAELVAAAAAQRAAYLAGGGAAGPGGGGAGGQAAIAAAAAKLLTAPPRRVSETPGAWDTPPLPPRQQQRMLRILRALDPSAAERLMYVEAASREDRAAGAAASAGGASASGSARRAARMRAQVSRVLRHMDAQVSGAGGAGEEDAGGGAEDDDDEDEEEEQADGQKRERAAAAAAAASSAHGAAAFALPPRPADLAAGAPASERAPLELVSAFIEAAIVGRQFHRGSGERHVAQVPTYPSFDGRPLDAASAEGAESELSALARGAARREDDGMWRDFRERLLHNLGVSGPGLWDVRGRARPQRPAEGWSMVVHPVGKGARRDGVGGGGGGGRGAAIEPRAGAGAPAGAGGLPYVSEPGGALRPLRGDEALLEKRRTPKRRRRWPL